MTLSNLAKCSVIRSGLSATAELLFGSAQNWTWVASIHGSGWVGLGLVVKIIW